MKYPDKMANSWIQAVFKTAAKQEVLLYRLLHQIRLQQRSQEAQTYSKRAESVVARHESKSELLMCTKNETKLYNGWKRVCPEDEEEEDEDGRGLCECCCCAAERGKC